jgi:hypothetical protein
MPRSKRRSSEGKGHHHTKKSERMANHIASAERKRGVGGKRAKQIAWATVHKDVSHNKRETKER